MFLRKPQDRIDRVLVRRAARCVPGDAEAIYAALGNHDDPNQRYYKPFNLGGNRYRTFKKDNVRFFILDSNYLDPAQVKWLEKELAEAASMLTADQRLAEADPLLLADLREGEELVLLLHRRPERALADEMPPAGHCEPLFQMALEVQGNFCGPHVPMLCLDWPSRVLMVSVQLDVTSLPADDAAQVLLGLREMALQWRAAIAEQREAALRPAASPTTPPTSR